MEKDLHFVGISGSLRKGSFNTMLLNNVRELLPEGANMEIVSIADIPVYNADMDFPAESERPEAVKKFRDILAKANALVIVSPEYNYSIPGGLKNAIDWASRGQDAPILNKPVALMGATTGMWGTIRMQMAFLPVFQALNMKVVYKPEILLAQAKSKFDENGKLTDTIAIDLVKKKLQVLKELVLLSGH
jgi:chromate reductase, NAD(P)H dehydrogenase (quinone)